MSLFDELMRRNVVRVGVAYAVIGWVLAQVAEFAFENFGAPDWVLKTVVVVLLLGLPLALFFAWAFEITPEGVKREEDVDRSRSITHSTGRKLDFVIIGALVVALGYFVWERQTYQSVDVPKVAVIDDVAEDAATGTTSDEDEDEVVENRTIAVLPFVNMSSNSEQEYFADGLTEEILNSLAKTPDLLVTARTSSFSYKGTDKPIPAIAEELGVGHILEGSVRRGGETLRITAQLIRAADGFHLWSETYDRTMDDIIAVQEEIAIQIANALKTTMDPEALAQMMRAGTNSVTAYEAYLTGRGLEISGNESGDAFKYLDVRDQHEAAIRIDPEFASAHWELARFWWIQAQPNQLGTGLTDLPRETIEENRDKAIENALRTQRDEVTKKVYRAVEAELNLDFRRALRLHTDYLDLRPNGDFALYGVFTNHERLGQYAELADIIRDRFANYEFSQNAANRMLQSIRLPEDVDLMRVVANEAIELFGNHVNLMYQAHRQLLWANDIDGASRLLLRLLSSDLDEDNRLLVELRQACAEKRLNDADSIHARILQDHAQSLAINWLAFEVMGDREASVELLGDYDDSEDFAMLETYLTYAHFDIERFPNFKRALADQGLEAREVIEVPYRCNR